MPDLSGVTLGKYTLQQRLGRGGMAEVYQAYHPGLDRQVAIKVLHAHLTDDPNFITRFQREAQAVAQLRHAHIVQIFDFDLHDDQPYMVMEYIAGRSLKDLLDDHFQRGQTLPLPVTLSIMRDLLQAIGYAHAQNMIHRDIKPANVMLEINNPSEPNNLLPASFRVVLTDFGIARLVSATKLTATGIGVGTPAYMSPEQGLGETGDTRSDLYALGIILYELLTGTVPFDGETSALVVLQHINAPIPALTNVRPDLSPAYDALLNRALAKNPAERYQTAAEFSAAIDTLLDENAPAPNAFATWKSPAPAPMAAPRAESAPTGVRQPITINLAQVLPLLVLAVIVALALALNFLRSPGRATPATPPALATAQTQLAAGQYQLAADSFTTYLSTDSNNPAALLGLAQAYEALGQIADAAITLDEFIAAAPQNSVAYQERGRLGAQYSLTDDPLTDLDKAIELDPNSARAYFLRGWAVLNFPLVNHAPDPAAAITDLQKSVALEASNAESQFTLGRALLGAGQPAEALAPLNRAIELEAAQPPYRLVRAYAQFSLGDFHAAVDDLSETMTLVTDPLQQAGLYAERAYLYQRLSDAARAQNDVAQALTLDPNSQIAATVRVYLDPTLPRPPQAELTRLAAAIPDDVIWQALIQDLSGTP